MKVACYCRVSTDDQELSQQIAACHRFAEAKGLEITHTYAEIGSGRDFARVEYVSMLAALRQQAFEGVVVFRLDRLGRSSREVVLLLEELEGRGIKVFSINESFDTSTPLGRAMREIICVLAQLEVENIREATKHRLQALKNMGKKLGRPEREFDVDKARQLRAEGWSWARMAKSLKVPAATIRLRLQKTVAAKALQEAVPEPAPATVGVSCKA